MSKFQIILTGIFVACIVGGVIAFATFRGSNSTTELPSISIWGTFPSTVFNEYIAKINNTAQQQLKIT